MPEHSLMTTRRKLVGRDPDLPPPGMAFTGGGITRGSLFDGDEALLESSDDACFLPVWRGKPLVTDTDQLSWVERTHSCLADADEGPVFLGLWQNRPRFAFDISNWNPGDVGPDEPDTILDRSVQHHPSAPPGTRLANLRTLMSSLSEPEAELAAVAKALLGWHARHRFCSNCGKPSSMTAAGWQRRCDICKADHFCRTDPVVIMLVATANSVLLGRAHGWPERLHSLLAGFVEPGETIEAAVRRETLEETGVRAGEVRYVASQPWPFPSSLMIGCWARAESTEIVLDRNELAAALWLTREEMLEVYATGDGPVAPPNRGTIAEHLIRLWLSGQLDFA